MSFLTYPFFTHHRYQIAIPLSHGSTLVLRITDNHISLQFFRFTMIGTDEVFFLPHIYKIFGNVSLFQLLSYLIHNVIS